MSVLVSTAFLLAVVLFQVSPWLSLMVFVGFCFLPFRKIIEFFPFTQPEGRIIKPLRERLKRDDPEA